MKKLMLVIPFMLLTAPLTSCKKDSVNPFTVNKEGYNEAINFGGKNTKYVQEQRTYGYISSGDIGRIIYWEEAISPTVFYLYNRTIDTTGSTITSDMRYIAKSGEEYWLYEQDETGKWEKSASGREEDFGTIGKLSDYIKSVLDSGNITYDIIKDYYDKDRQGYYFSSTSKSDVPYNVNMSFYNNRLTSFSYEYFDEKSSQTEFGTASYTYGTITPELPDVPEI